MGLAFLISTDKLSLLSERKVLKESEYAVMLDASGVVAEAQKEAQRIVQAAQYQAEQKLREGFEEGLGRAREEYAGRLLAVAMGSQEQLQSVRNAVGHLVVKAVHQFIVDADPVQLFEAALMRVDVLIRNEPFVFVRVAPEQVELVNEVIERLSRDAHWTMKVSVQPDPALPEGGCVLQTASGSLEIGVDAQLRVFEQAVNRGAFQG